MDRHLSRHLGFRLAEGDPPVRLRGRVDVPPAEASHLAVAQRPEHLEGVEHPAIRHERRVGGHTSASCMCPIVGNTCSALILDLPVRVQVSSLAVGLKLPSAQSRRLRARYLLGLGFATMLAALAAGYATFAIDLASAKSPDRTYEQEREILAGVLFVITLCLFFGGAVLLANFARHPDVIDGGRDLVRRVNAEVAILGLGTIAFFVSTAIAPKYFLDDGTRIRWTAEESDLVPQRDMTIPWAILAGTVVLWIGAKTRRRS